MNQVRNEENFEKEVKILKNVNKLNFTDFNKNNKNQIVSLIYNLYQHISEQIHNNTCIQNETELIQHQLLLMQFYEVGANLFKNVQILNEKFFEFKDELDRQDNQFSVCFAYICSQYMIYLYRRTGYCDQILDDVQQQICDYTINYVNCIEQLIDSNDIVDEYIVFKYLYMLIVNVLILQKSYDIFANISQKIIQKLIMFPHNSVYNDQLVEYYSRFIQQALDTQYSYLVQDQKVIVYLIKNHYYLPAKNIVSAIGQSKNVSINLNTKNVYQQFRLKQYCIITFLYQFIDQIQQNINNCVIIDFNEVINQIIDTQEEIEISSLQNKVDQYEDKEDGIKYMCICLYNHIKNNDDYILKQNIIERLLAYGERNESINELLDNIR